MSIRKTREMGMPLVGVEIDETILARGQSPWRATSRSKAVGPAAASGEGSRTRPSAGSSC